MPRISGVVTRQSKLPSGIFSAWECLLSWWGVGERFAYIMSCEISSTALIIFGCFMNLYLSSYRLGDRAAVLAAMVSGNKRVGVISNALDFSAEAGWLEAGEEQECTDLEKIGLDPEPIDLRDYFDARPALQRVVRTLDAVWVVGGNTFIL